MFNCPALSSHRSQIWKEAKKKIITRVQEIVDKNKSDSEEKGCPIRVLQLIDQWEATASKSSQDLINICLGLFDEQKRYVWKKEAKKDGIKGESSQTILNTFSNSLLKLFRKKIWVPRCEEVIAWERTQGITRKEKRGKDIHLNKSVEGEVQGACDATDLSRKPGNTFKNKRSGKKTRGRNKEKDRSLGDKVKETVWSWIREGKKWLGY